MSLGIGLGSFMSSFERGYGLRQDIDENRLKKQNRADLKQIDTDTKAAFDKEVAAGTTSPEKFDEFWTKFALPKRKMALLEQGDVAGAKALMDWGNSEAALQGGRLFSSAMLKAQTGDAAGALADAVKAGQVQGYINSGYEILGQDEIRDPAGKTVGFRLRMKDASGKTIEQDVAAGDVPRVVSTFVNPDAAYQSQVASRAAEKKRADEVTDYEAKKKIDKTYETPKIDNAETYRKVREERMKNDLTFADLTPEEQDKAIRADLAAAEGYAAERKGAAAPGSAPVVPGSPVAPAAPAAPAKKVIVDETTGETMPVAPAPTVSPSGIERAPLPAPTGLGQAQPTADAGAQRQAMIADAADYMSKGGNAQAIAQRLMSAGIAETEWPQAVRSAFAGGNQPIGLGR